MHTTYSEHLLTQFSRDLHLTATLSSVNIAHLTSAPNDLCNFPITHMPCEQPKKKQIQ